MKSFRLTLTALVLLLAVALPASLSAGGKPAADSSGSTKMRIAWFGTQARNQATLAALDAYTAAHPTVTFDAEIASSNPEFSDKLATQAAAQNIPDVIVMDLQWIKDYSTRKQLLELAKVDTSKINAPLLADGSLNGKLYALPNAVASTAFVYDKKRVDELGLSSMVKNGWTWDEFYAFCEAAKPKVGAKYVTADFSYSHTMYTAYQNSQGHGSPITLDGKINFNRQDFLDYQKKLAEFRQKGIVPPPDVTVTNRDGDVTLDPLLTGNVLIKNAYSSTFGSWDGVEPGRYALVAMPRGTQSSDYVKVASFWSAAANTKYPDLAQTVINWLVNDPDAGKILGFARGGAVNSDVLKALTPVLSARDKASAELVDYITPTAQPFTMWAEGWNNYYMVDYEALCQEILFGRVTPEAGYDRVVAKAREYVK